VFRWTAAARLAGARVFFVSVGAGPAYRPLSRWLLVSATRLASYRSFRDAKSKAYLGSVGVDTRRDEVYPDLAFKLPVPDLPRNGSLDADPATIVVGVMNYNGWHGHARPDDTIFDTYIAKLTRVVRSLLDRGFRIRILIGDLSDQHAVARLQSALAADQGANPGRQVSGTTPDRVIAEPVNSLADVMRQISDAKVVIASRFHNVVCALKLARPTISLGYEDKNDAVMQTFDLGQFCQHIEHFDPDWVLRQVDEQLSNHAVYEQKIRQKLPRLRTRIAEQERVLVQML
jgi:polysaccharide pyruvyl transferase WcaK-like protein